MTNLDASSGASPGEFGLRYVGDGAPFAARGLGDLGYCENDLGY